MHTSAIQAEVPSIDGCCVKEVYAFFGLVAYSAQVLEHGALNLAIVLRLPSVDKITKKDFDNLYQQLTQRTLGSLTSAAKKVIEIPEDQEKLLQEAVALRNYVTHHYFRDRAEDFVSASGQEQMKREMQGFIATFTEADQVLASFYQPLWNKYGVTEEYIQEKTNLLAEQARERDKHA